MSWNGGVSNGVAQGFKSGLSRAVASDMQFSRFKRFRRNLYHAIGLFCAVGWAKARLRAVPTICAVGDGGHATGRFRVRWLCPPCGMAALIRAAFSWTFATQQEPDHERPDHQPPPDLLAERRHRDLGGDPDRRGG